MQPASKSEAANANYANPSLHHIKYMYVKWVQVSLRTRFKKMMYFSCETEEVVAFLRGDKLGLSEERKLP